MPTVITASPRVLYGRKDILARLDECLSQLAGLSTQAHPLCGYVFLLGTAGTGTSAIALKWAEHAAALPATKVVFLRLERRTTQQELHNQLRRSLGELFEVRLSLSEAGPSLDKLLQQVSERLGAGGERLVLVFDNLDDVEVQPLTELLPRLSAHVYALCAAEPTYHVRLAHGACAREYATQTLDLDAPQFRPSALAACSECLGVWLSQQSPVLPSVQAATLSSLMLAKADGNMLYLQYLFTFLQELPRSRWEESIAKLPSQLDNFLDGRWNDICGRAPSSVPRETLQSFLLLLAAAYEPLPPDVVRKLLDRADIDHLREVARWWVRTNGDRLLVFHGCARAFLVGKLGSEALKSWHGRLADHARDQWKEPDPWLPGYALLHAPRHYVEAGRLTEALSLSLRSDFFSAQVRAEHPGGTWVLQDVLTSLAQLDDRYLPLLDAIRVEAGPLASDPEVLLTQLYQRLCSDGLSAREARDLLDLPAAQPALRLLHPLPATERPRQVFPGSHEPLRSLIFGPGGRLLSLDYRGNITEWDVERAVECRTRLGSDTFFPPFCLCEDGGDILLVDIKGGVVAVVPYEPDSGGTGQTEQTRIGLQLVDTEDTLLSCSIAKGQFAGVTCEGKIITAALPGAQPASPPIRFLAYRLSPDGFVISGVAPDGTAASWTFAPPGPARPAEEPALHPCVSARDGSVALLGLQSAQGLLYAVRPQAAGSPELLSVCRVHAQRKVTACALSPDGELALSSDAGGHLVLWATRSGMPLWKVSLPRCRQVRVVCLAVLSGTVSVFAGFENGEIWAWEKSLKPETTSAPIDSASPRVPRVDKLLGLSSDGKIVALRGLKLLLWGWEDDTPTVLALPGLMGPLLGKLLKRPDGEAVLLYKRDSPDHALYHIQKQELVLQPFPKELFFNLLFISPSGQVLLIRDGDSAASIVHRSDLTQRIPLVDFCPRLCNAVIPEDEATLILADSRHLRIWDLRTGQVLATLCPCEPGEFNELELSADGRELLAVTERGWRRWDLTTRTELTPTPFPPLPDGIPGVEACALLSRPRICTSGEPGPDIPCVALIHYLPSWLMVCRRDTGECITRFHGFLANAGLLSDGSRLAAVDSNGALWRMGLRPHHDKLRVYILGAEDPKLQLHALLGKKLDAKRSVTRVVQSIGQPEYELPEHLDLVVALLRLDDLGDLDRFVPQWKEALDRYWAGELELLPVKRSYVNTSDLMEEDEEAESARSLPPILMDESPLDVQLSDAQKAPSAWQELMSAVEQKLGLPAPQSNRSSRRSASS